MVRGLISGPEKHTKAILAYASQADSNAGKTIER